MITTYSLAKHGNEKLSENFRVYEFRCRDGSDEVRISSETVAKLQAVRDYFGRAVTINSGYRTPSHNKIIKGATNSQHVVGTACDIVVKGVPPAAVAAFLEAKFPKSGIGLYGSFVHIDSRGYKSYWDQRSGKQVVVTSFKLGNIFEKYKANEADREQEELEMTMPEIKKALLADKDFCRQCAETYINELKSKPASAWAEEDVEWAKSNSISDGTNPQAFISREQAMAMVHRLAMLP